MDVCKKFLKSEKVEKICENFEKWYLEINKNSYTTFWFDLEFINSFLFKNKEFVINQTSNNVENFVLYEWIKSYFLPSDQEAFWKYFKIFGDLESPNEYLISIALKMRILYKEGSFSLIKDPSILHTGVGRYNYFYTCVKKMDTFKVVLDNCDDRNFLKSASETSPGKAWRNLSERGGRAMRGLILMSSHLEKDCKVFSEKFNNLCQNPTKNFKTVFGDTKTVSSTVLSI